METGVQIATTPIGLALPTSLAFNDWASKVYWAALMSSRVNWYLADVLNHPLADTHEGLQLIAEVQQKFAHLTDGTLANIKSIGARYSFEERTELSWSHHAAVAYVDPTIRALLLEDAQAKDLNVKELRERVKETNGNNSNTSKRSLDDDDSGADEAREDAPTREDFDDARERCLRHWRDLGPIIKDRALTPRDLAAAGALLLKSLQELIKIGEAL